MAVGVDDHLLRDRNAISYCKLSGAVEAAASVDLDIIPDGDSTCATAATNFDISINIDIVPEGDVGGADPYAFAALQSFVAKPDSVSPCIRHIAGPMVKAFN